MSNFEKTPALEPAPGTSPGVALHSSGGHSNGRTSLPAPSLEIPPATDGFRGYPVDDDDDTIDWRGLGRAFRRRYKLFLLIFALVFGLGTLKAWLSPPVYQSSIQLLINTGNKSNAAAALTNIPGLSDALSSTGARSQDTEVALLQGSSIREGAIARLKNYSAREVNQSLNLAVRPVKNTDIIEVVTTHENPKIAQELAKAIGQEYLAQKQSANTEQYRYTAKFLEGQLKIMRANLGKARDNIENYKRQIGITDIGAEGTLRNQQYATILSNLRQTQTERAAAQASLAKMREILVTLPLNQVSSSTRVPTPILDQLRRDLANAQSEANLVAQDFTDDSPEVRAARAKVQLLEKQIASVATTQPGASTTAPNPTRVDLLGRIAQAQGELQGHVARENSLRRELKLAQQQLSNLPSYENRLSDMQTELATTQGGYQNLLQQYQNVLISTGAPMSNARAYPPEKARQIAPNLPRSVVLFAILGLLLGVTAALIADRIDDRVYSESDAMGAAKVPILALVPAAKGRSPLVLERQSPALLETYRMLRTNLQFSALDRPLRLLAITSSKPNEGKTTSALNLATTVALSGKKVILVDCDLRRPTLHSALDLQNTAGFTDLAVGTHTLDQVLQKTLVENLFFLSAGMLPPNPPEFLDSALARNAMQTLAAHADMVIVDTPPAMLMADAKIIATMVDGVLMVVGAQESRASEVTRTSQNLAPTGKLLGAVLNKVAEEDSGYRSYRAYGHYLDNDTAPDKPALNA